MSFLMKCPFCSAQIKLPEAAQMATCPKCANTFRAVRPEEAEAIAARQQAHGPVVDREPYDSTDDYDDDTDTSDAQPAETSLPGWLSPWGLGAFLLAGAAFLLAVLAGVRWLTIVFSCLGMLTVLAGIARTAKNRQTKDTSWLAIGGLFSAAVLGITFFAPGLLNRYWGMDTALPTRDPLKLVVVPRDEPRSEGQPLSPDAWADPAEHAIRQDDVLVRLESAVLGPVAERPGKDYLLIHLRIGNGSNEKKLAFEGFAKDKHPLLLKDGSGRAYEFLEQRIRKLKAGPPHVFIPAPVQTEEIYPTRSLDYQLVFEPPPAIDALTLEIPATAWGRKGACKFRISEPFALYLYLKKD